MTHQHQYLSAWASPEFPRTAASEPALPSHTWPHENKHASTHAVHTTQVLYNERFVITKISEHNTPPFVQQTQCTDTTEKLLWFLLKQGSNTILPTCVCCCWNRLIAPQVQPFSAASMTRQELSHITTLSQWWWRKICCQSKSALRNYCTLQAQFHWLWTYPPTYQALGNTSMQYTASSPLGFIAQTVRGDCKYDESSCLRLECNCNEAYGREQLSSWVVLHKGSVTVTMASDFLISCHCDSTGVTAALPHVGVISLAMPHGDMSCHDGNMV